MKNQTERVTVVLIVRRMKAGECLTRHTAVSAQTRVKFTVDQRGVKQPLAEEIQHAVDLRSGWGRERPGL